MQNHFFYFIFLAVFFFFPSFSRAAVDTKAPVVSAKILKKSETSKDLVYPARAEAKVNAAILAESEGVVTKVLPLGTVVKRGDRLLNITQTDPIYNFAPFKVVSPVSGAVSEVLVTEGTRVARGQRLATVTNPDSLQFNFELTTTDMKDAKVGLKGIFKIDSLKDPVEVVITGISPYVNNMTGTSTVVAEPTKKNLKIFPGVLGQVQFKTAVRSTFLVPESSVVYRGDSTFVRVIENNKAKFKKVSLGFRSLDTVEIVEGLTENEVYIERASRFVADGADVTVQDEKEQKKN